MGSIPVPFALIAPLALLLSASIEAIIQEVVSIVFQKTKEMTLMCVMFSVVLIGFLEGFGK